MTTEHKPGTVSSILRPMNIHKLMGWIEENLALIAPVSALVGIVVVVLLHWVLG